jgi:hypothetical protein
LGISLSGKSTLDLLDGFVAARFSQLEGTLQGCGSPAHVPSIASQSLLARYFAVSGQSVEGEEMPFISSHDPSVA